MSRILVISFSDLARDSRVDRQLEFLRPSYEVVAAGLGPPADPAIRFIDLRTPARSRAAELIRQTRSLAALVARRYEHVYWCHPVTRHALASLTGHGAELVIANDLTALPIACRVAGDAPVILDAHELATEEHADRIWWRAIMAPYAHALLRSYLPRAAAVMTVSEGIGDRYAQLYGVQPVIVTNAPPEANLTPTAVGNPIRMVHHGVAHPNRQIELMIEAAELLGGRFELDLMVMPSDTRYFTHLKRRVSACSHVTLVEPVDQRDIVVSCNKYDVGVFLLPPINDNHRYVLPNKLFEFIQARLAVAIGPSVEMAPIVQNHDCGVVADDFTAQALADALRGLTPERVFNYKQHSHLAARQLHAGHNREIVLRLVSDVLEG